MYVRRCHLDMLPECKGQDGLATQDPAPITMPLNNAFGVCSTYVCAAYVLRSLTSYSVVYGATSGVCIGIVSVMDYCHYYAGRTPGNNAALRMYAYIYVHVTVCQPTM